MTEMDIAIDAWTVATYAVFDSKREFGRVDLCSPISRTDMPEVRLDVLVDMIFAGIDMKVAHQT